MTEEEFERFQRESARNELQFSPEGHLIPPAPTAPDGTARIINDQITDAVTTPYYVQGTETQMLGDGWNKPAPVSVAGGKSRRRARRFHADTPFVLSLLLILILAMAGASFYVSFWGVYEAASWAVGANPPLQFAVPLMLDVAIIAFTLSLFIERERGEKVWGTWTAISAFTIVSAFANVTHAFAVSTAQNEIQMLVGSIIAGGAPVLLAFATDKIAVKVFKTAGNEIDD